MQAIRRYFSTPTALRRWALGSLIANIGIVVTGGAVRLTGSGLGCPTWPKCDAHSYVSAPERGYHAYIEFGNRTLISVVGTLAVIGVLAAFLAAPPAARSWRRWLASAGTDLDVARIWWALAVLIGIPAQALLGGITTLSDLNPWVVATHFLLSALVIAAAYQFWVRTTPAATGDLAGAPLRALVWAIVAVTGAVLIAGTITTGSGPHAGDATAKRTGLNPENVAQLHTDLVMLLIGLSVAAWFALRITGASAAARTALVLVGVECAQAVIGFVQYFTHLPIILVGAHMLGACLVWVAALRLLTATKPLPFADDLDALAMPSSRKPDAITR